MIFAAYVAYYLSLVIRLLVLGRLAWKGWLFSLPLFSVFCLATCAQTVVLSFYFGDIGRHSELRAMFAPFMALLQIGAGAESFFWFVRSIPKFRRPGLWMFGVLAFGSLFLERSTAPDEATIGVLQQMAKLERGVGVGLGMTLLLALIAFSAFSRIPQAARWHAACLAGLSMGNALGWQARSSWLIVGTVIATFTAWLFTVKESPSKDEAIGDHYEAEAVELSWRTFEAKARRAKDRFRY